MKILIVEDDRSLAAGLGQGLREQGFETTLAATASQARQCLAEGSFDLVILDLGLPDEDGLALMAELQGREVPLPVIITTARGSLDQRLTGLQSGADDYLAKPYAFAELLARIQIQLRHTRQRLEARLHVADLEIDHLTRTVRRDNEPIELTPREFEVLACLAAAHGQPVSRETLARQVWQLRCWTISMDNVLDVHISRLREKIDRHHSRKLLHTVRGVGYALRAPEDSK